MVDDLFESVLRRPNVTCHLNVDVGVHVTLEEICDSHHAVIYAGGATGDRRLGIDGEKLDGSFSAREFVSWYNGHPDFAERTFDLSSPVVVVIGNGNVALDVARILTRPIDDLAVTDIADHALDALRTSSVREVVIIARRGAADAACTFPELLELVATPGVQVRVPAADLRIDDATVLTPAQRSKLELFRRVAGTAWSSDPSSRRITFRFGLEPVQLDGSGHVQQATFRSTASPTAPAEHLATGMVVRAVGYTVSPTLGLPFDVARGTIANVGGRVVDLCDAMARPGLYCVGWAKRGASGVIGTNKFCSRETVGQILDDLASGALPEPTLTAEELRDLITRRHPMATGLTEWQEINRHEQRRGQESSPQRPRRKFVEIPRMLDAAGIRTRVILDRPARRGATRP
jgi:ferredoxin--NADP+ reductase